MDTAATHVLLHFFLRILTRKLGPNINVADKLTGTQGVSLRDDKNALNSSSSGITWSSVLRELEYRESGDVETTTTKDSRHRILIEVVIILVDRRAENNQTSSQ